MTYVNSAESRFKAVCDHGNSEQRADEGSAMLTVAAASENGCCGVQAWFHKSLGPEFLAVNVVNPLWNAG